MPACRRRIVSLGTLLFACVVISGCSAISVESYGSLKEHTHQKYLIQYDATEWLFTPGAFKHSPREHAARAWEATFASAESMPADLYAVDPGDGNGGLGFQYHIDVLSDDGGSERLFSSDRISWAELPLREPFLHSELSGKPMRQIPLAGKSRPEVFGSFYIEKGNQYRVIMTTGTDVPTSYEPELVLFRTPVKP